MTKDEALLMALEALEESKTNNDTMEFHDRKNKAITAIKQARSAPVQEPVQEPVAWMGTDIEGNPNKFRLNPFNGGVELYKKPQSVKVWDAEGYDALMQELELWKAAAQRQWVGLEEKEIDKLKHLIDWTATWSHGRFAYEIEQLLKEKNA